MAAPSLPSRPQKTVDIPLGKALGTSAAPCQPPSQLGSHTHRVPERSFGEALLGQVARERSQLSGECTDTKVWEHEIGICGHESLGHRSLPIMPSKQARMLAFSCGMSRRTTRSTQR